MAFISEADVEAALLDQLEALGYSRLGDSIAGVARQNPICRRNHSVSGHCRLPSSACKRPS